MKGGDAALESDGSNTTLDLSLDRRVGMPSLVSPIEDLCMYREQMSVWPQSLEMEVIALEHTRF